MDASHDTPPVERPPINPGRRLPISSGALWLEDAWRGWIKQVFILLIVISVAGLYYFELLGEVPVTVVIGTLSAILPPLVAGRHRLGQLESGEERPWVLLWTFLACVAAPLWILGTLITGPVQVSGVLDGTHRLISSPNASISTHFSDSVLLVRAQVEREGRFPYELALESAVAAQEPTEASADSVRTVHGMVRVQQSEGRGGRQLISGSLVETGASRNRLERTSGVGSVRLIRKDPAIERLEVSLHSDWLPWRLLAGISLVLIGWALWMDVRVSGAYARSWLVVSVTTTLPAGLMFYLNASHVNLLKQWVGTGVIWAVLGTAAGIGLHTLGRRVVAATQTAARAPLSS